MPKLIVIVKKLNKRKVVPAILPDPNNIAGFVIEGHTFEGVEVDIANIPNPASGKWYKDRDGYFYWGGGVREIKEAKAATDLPTRVVSLETRRGLPFDPAKMSWGHQFYDIPFIWNDLNTMGKGATVAVIDTGVDDKHSDLISNIHPLSKSFTGNEKDISDIEGHGTQMAGIIAASGNNQVFGVAPAAKLLILKATPDGSGTDLQKFIDAVNFASGLAEVDIISISYSFVTSKFDEQRLRQIELLRQAIQKCLDAQKIVVASIGDLRTPISPPEDRDTFPACFNNGIPDSRGVLAVGAFDVKGNLCDFSNWNRHLSFLAPGDFSVLTTGLNNTTTNGSQTSIAAAFTAGCLALVVSYCKIQKADKSIDYVGALLSSCDDIGPVVGPDVRSGLGRLNFRNAVSKIKII